MTTTEPASTIGPRHCRGTGRAVAGRLGPLFDQRRVRSPTSSMSAADLLAVLMTRHLHYDWDQPHLPVNDHLIFSKGHASPLLYSVFKAAGSSPKTNC